MSRKPRQLLVLVFVCLVIVAVYYVANIKARTAKEYYLEILPDPSFATRTPPQSERKRVIRRLERRGHSAEELNRLNQQYKPVDELEPLLEDIALKLPPRYERCPDVFAGVYPSSDFNATTLKSPGGGYVILVSYDLKKGLWEWAKLVLNALSWQPGTGLQPDDTLDQIINDFRMSTLKYVQSGLVPKFPQYTDDEKGDLVALLHTAALKFILAHEYAHISLGHVNSTTLA